MAILGASKAVRREDADGQTAAIRLAGVSVRLGERLALRDIDCAIAPGAFVGLLGPNGSGKSTLLRAVLGILPLSAGRVDVFGRPPEQARDRFSYLPQRQRVDIELPVSVWDVVLMGRLRHTGWLGAVRAADREAATWALEQVRLIDRRRSPIRELSFGQQQRVFFARALVQEGDLILLDEPMNGVDAQTQDLFVELLETFHAGGRTIVMATHDLNMAACICDSLLILNQTLVAYGPVSSTFRPEVLQAAYGAHLHFLEALAPNGHPEVLEDVHHHDTDFA